jgi:hypothetical protein
LQAGSVKKTHLGVRYESIMSSLSSVFRELFARRRRVSACGEAIQAAVA